MTSTVVEPDAVRSPAAPPAPTRHEDRPATPRGAPGAAGCARSSAAGPATRRGSGRRCSLLLVGTAVLYLWGLGASGWANTYLLGRGAGGHEELEGVLLRLVRRVELRHRRQAARVAVGDGAVGAALRRELVEHPRARRRSRASPRSGSSTSRCAGGSRPGPALLAGAVLALTPVAALMFRFNNPDALLVLLLVARRLRDDPRPRARQHLVARAARSRWSASGSSPRCCRRSSWCPRSVSSTSSPAPVSLRRRVVQLTAGRVRALLVSAGWWIADRRAVAGGVAPVHRRLAEQQRPRADLRVQRLRPPHRQRDRQRRRRRRCRPDGGVPTGLTRMFGAEFGRQISWLLPAALILLVAGLVVARPRPRTDRVRAAFILWGGWLLVTGLVVQPRQGDHPPVLLRRPRAGDRRARRHGRRHAVEAAPRREGTRRARGRRASPRRSGAFDLLGRTPQWNPWLRGPLLLVGVLVAGALLAAHLVHGRALVALALAAIAVVLAAPAGYTLSTVNTPHTGAIPSAGPAGASSLGLPGGRAAAASGARRTVVPEESAPRRPAGSEPTGADRRRTAAARAGCSTAAPRARRCGSCSTPTAARTPGSRPTIGANQAAGYQLATDDPIMAIGGFNGTDPTPTLAQFQQYVREGRIHYFIGGGAASAAAARRRRPRAPRRRSRRG